MSTVDITGQEMTDSLTGFDELAIKGAFKVTLKDVNTDPVLLLRALVFVDKRRREGLNDKQAYQAAMEMRLGDVQVYFAPEPEPEFDPDEPETEAGKGD